MGVPELPLCKQQSEQTNRRAAQVLGQPGGLFRFRGGLRRR
jgi:hypothetical protein